MVVHGQRQAIAVTASEVYQSAHDGKPGSVEGSTAAQLAEGIYNEITTSYPSIPEEVIKGAWMGMVCDGAYQAAEFGSTLKRTLNQQTYDESFLSVVWDSAHYMDLAVTDVREGKKGASKSFLKHFIGRTSEVHRMFQRGKMLSHAREMERENSSFHLKLTSRACSTRFSTSQYVEFLKLLDSLPRYIETVREFLFSERTEYKIAGADFIMNLCGVCDILSPVMTLLVAVQQLSCP